MHQFPVFGSHSAPGESHDAIGACERAVETLGRRGLDLRDACAAWSVRECGPAASLRVDSSSLPFAPMTERSVAGTSPSGVVVEGVAALESVWRATERSADGFRPRVYVVQREIDELLDGLAGGVCRGALEDARVVWYVGSGAAAELARELSGRPECALPSHVVRTPGVTPIVPSVEEVVRGSRAAQEREHAGLLARVGARYEGRDASFWHERLGAGDGDRGGDGGPVRVLIPTTRHSTYLRHAAGDLAEGFRACGCEAMVLEEGTAHDKLSSIAYLRAFESFEPDLVVLLNYARAQLAHVVPGSIPVVCWVQDRMAHLFDERMGRGMGELDHVWGHLHPSLFTDFGYPRERARWGVVPASARTFHDGPVVERLACEHTCDIAYASHQSETPEAFCARLQSELGEQGPVARTMEAIRGELARLCGGGAEGSVRGALDGLTESVLRSCGVASPDARLVAVLEARCTRPLAELLWRHRTLEWASAIAAKHGLRFHVYGKGWDRHPTLGVHARGALAHGEALRASYRCARVHLHASLASNAHQRVFECALSGGVMLRRGPSPDMSLVKKCVLRLVHEAFEPTGEGGHRTGTCLEYELGLPRVEDIGSAEAWRTPDVDRLRRMKGKPAPAARGDGLLPARFRVLDADIERDFALIPEIPLWTFPDYAFPLADETLFYTPEQLEAMILRAVRDEAWREATAQGHREVALEWHTYERTAREMLRFVAGSMAAGAREPARTVG